MAMLLLGETAINKLVLLLPHHLSVSWRLECEGGAMAPVCNAVSSEIFDDICSHLFVFSICFNEFLFYVKV